MDLLQENLKLVVVSILSGHRIAPVVDSADLAPDIVILKNYYR
jgi:hypothetical protein